MAAGQGRSRARATWAFTATASGRPMRPMERAAKTGGTTQTASARVMAPFSAVVKRKRRCRLSRSATSAVEALMIRMMGDSKSMPKGKATPKAAKLRVGSARRAITAAMKGPSTAISSHAASSGSHARRTRL